MLNAQTFAREPRDHAASPISIVLFFFFFFFNGEQQQAPDGSFSIFMFVSDAFLDAGQAECVSSLVGTNEWVQLSR